MIKQAYDNGEFQTSDTALQFILDSADTVRDAFQTYLRENLLSSHLFCIARKP
jgi:hypothetical protein